MAEEGPMMSLPKPFFDVARKGDGVVMHVNAMEIATVEPTWAKTTLIIMRNGNTIEAKASIRDVEFLIQDALAKEPT